MKNARLRLRCIYMLVALTFTLTSCNQTTKQKKVDGEESTNSEVQKQEIQASQEKSIKVQAPNQIIEAEEAKKLYDNYGNRRANLIEKYEKSVEPEANFDVARYVSYDLETVKQYIAFVEQQAEEAQVNVKSLRFYFANYPNESGFEHPRQNSIMIVPTTTDITGKEAGFYTTSEEGKRKALTIKSLFENNAGMGLLHNNQKKAYASMLPNFSTTAAFADQSLIMNRGQSAPPPKKEGDF